MTTDTDELPDGPYLVAEGLSKAYHAGSEVVHAVRDVSLALRPGELVLLTGASGSGKSTLLHMLAGLEPPDSGSVQVHGQVLTGVGAARSAALRLRHIGVVFQDGNLIDELNAQDNVSLPLEVAGTSRSAARSAAQEALRAVGLDGLGARLPAELSGGQRQRVAVARALVGSRRVLLADEPTGSLDSETGRQVIDVIRRLCDSGAAAVVASHDLRHTRVADSAIEMCDGRIVAVRPGYVGVERPSTAHGGVAAQGA